MLFLPPLRCVRFQKIDHICFAFEELISVYFLSGGLPMYTRQKLNIGIWVTVCLTAVLLVLTAVVLFLRLGSFLPNDIDVLFLTPRNAKLELADDYQNWDNRTTIQLFSAEYVNEDGEVVVQNLVDDGALIAPGVETSYKFYVKNTGNVALDYAIALDPKFIIASEHSNVEGIPFEVRVYNQHGTYLIGSENEWVSVDDAELVIDSGIVGKNSYYSYVFEWRWKYESGNDRLDTSLGNLAIHQPVVLALDIGTIASESSDVKAQGGSPLPPNGVGPEGGEVVQNTAAEQQDGGTIRWIPMTVLIVLTVISGVALGWMIIVHRKRKDL